MFWSLFINLTSKMHTKCLGLGPWDSWHMPSHTSDMFIQSVYIFVTYSLVVMAVILNNFSFQLARCTLNFRDAGIKKLEPLCMAIINSIK